MIDQIIFGIIGMAVGTSMVIYARPIINSIGTSATAERYFGSGGSYTALRLAGMFVTAVSFLYMTGLLERVVLNIFHSLGF